MTYSELQSAIADWLQRSDLTSIIPTWIRFATAGFNRTLRVPQMESRDSSSLTAEFSAIPTDMLEVVAIHDDDGNELRYLGRQEFAAVVSNGARPNPAIYTIEDYQLRVLPAPSVSEPLDVTITYFEQVPALVAAADTNWLLTDYPDLYLYGSLIHARAWLHDDKRLVLVKQFYESGLAELRRFKWAATGAATVRQTDVPSSYSTYDITRGY